MATIKSFSAWLGDRWRASGDADEEYRPDLLDQFYSTLHVIALGARSHGVSEGANTEVDAKLKKAL